MESHAGRLAPEVEDEIIAMYESGIGGPGISEELGVSLSTIYVVLRRNQVPRRSGGRQMTTDYTAHAQDYKDNVLTGNITVTDFMLKWGIIPATLAKIRRLYDLPFVQGSGIRGGAAQQVRVERDAAMIKDYQEGNMPATHVALKHGVEMATLYKALREAGVPTRKEQRDESLAKTLARAKELRAEREARMAEIRAAGGDGARGQNRYLLTDSASDRGDTGGGIEVGNAGSEGAGGSESDGSAGSGVGSVEAGVGDGGGSDGGDREVLGDVERGGRGVGGDNAGAGGAGELGSAEGSGVHG